MSRTSSYYVYAGKHLTLTPVDSARYIEPANLNLKREDFITIAQSDGLGLDMSFPKRFVVKRGSPLVLQLLREKHQDKIYATRAAYVDHQNGLEVFLTNEVILKLREGRSIKDLKELLKFLKIDIDKVEAGPRFEKKPRYWLLRVEDPVDDAPLHVANRLAQERSLVKYAEPNFLQKSLRNQQPGLFQPTQATYFEKQWHLFQIKVNEAWDWIAANVGQEKKFGSPAIKVVVIDSGMDLGHPAFTNDSFPNNKYNIMLPGDLEPNNPNPIWDFDNYDKDPSCEGDAHGTACAGLIGARGQVVGVAPNCKIIPLRASITKTSDMDKAFLKALELGGDIISFSQNILANNTLDQTIKDLACGICTAYSRGRNGKGIPILCSSGNFGQSLKFPAWLPGVIAVGACTEDKTRYNDSCCGPELDFLAPGGYGISTTDISTAQQGYNLAMGVDGGYYDNFGGTSSAAAVAAGVAALMLSVNPNLTAYEVQEILQDTADELLGQTGWSEAFGHGRINALEAVKEAHMRVLPGP